MVASVGLIGDPVEHSLSPALQGAAFAYHGRSPAYDLWRTSLAELEQRVARLREPGMLGANVTLPHKTAVIPLLDELDPTAEAVGAVNTIVRLENGWLRGLNTDVAGFVRALWAVNFTLEGRAAVMLGAGGAARAVAFGLVQAGIASLTVANRTQERAEELLADALAATDAEPHLLALSLDDPALGQAISEADVLINATSVGLDRATLPLSPDTIAPHLLVVDLIYWRTPLLEAAEGRGARTQDGLEMLVQQGALAFEAWTALPAPVEVMREAARRTLQERS